MNIQISYSYVEGHIFYRMKFCFPKYIFHENMCLYKPYSGGSRAIDYASGEKRKIMSRTLRIKH